MPDPEPLFVYAKSALRSCVITHVVSGRFIRPESEEVVAAKVWDAEGFLPGETRLNGTCRATVSRCLSSRTKENCSPFTSNPYLI